MARRSKSLFRRFQRGFERVLSGPSPPRRLLTVLLGAAAGWWIFVPVHELLHAAGCLLGGGKVTRLEIAPLYGGSLLEKIFPFVAAGGEYAGRLSGFDTAGSGWTYALTVLAPYLLVPLGFFLMGRAAAASSPLLFGVSAPLALSPLLALTGDFLELGGLLLFQFWSGPAGENRQWISDDLFRLLGDLSRAPNPPPSAVPFAAVSQILGVILAWLCLRLSQTAWRRRRENRSLTRLSQN